ncbi:cation:proton antiporter, partial [Burkholderia sp.]|uniref:cation:proton antiporter domain-containing protein n=1 Tax=Burkholderia sp. TaxID=36773 RepID=UPI0025BF7752
MPHDVSLIALLAAGFGLALIFGYLASLLKMPPLVGYLLAGIVIGPGTPGFVADLSLAQQLAEIGVMLLMFGVGLHFSLGDLLAVRKIALPGAIVQITVATLLGAFLLNRVAEEGYGGTPAQFDVIGLLVGFLASGNGLSTNEQIATWIDDAWENGTGERLFGTDANAGNDEFDAGAATEDTLHQSYRASAMPETDALIRVLREHGLA